MSERTPRGHWDVLEARAGIPEGRAAFARGQGGGAIRIRGAILVAKGASRENDRAPSPGCRATYPADVPAGPRGTRAVNRDGAGLGLEAFRAGHRKGVRRGPLEEENGPFGALEGSRRGMRGE